AKADEWSRNYQVEATIDLTHPGSVPVWKGVQFYGVTPGGKWAGAHMYLTCNSESDTSFGACPTKLAHWAGTGSNVTLRFTNLKTKAMTDLTVTGKWWTPCGNGDDGFVSVAGLCGCWGPMKFDANLTETELRKLPYGGVWVAQMQLKTMEW
ncbi:hypothetical protein AB1E84_004397, partial [Yersinia enterocolitica]